MGFDKHIIRIFNLEIMDLNAISKKDGRSLGQIIMILKPRESLWLQLFHSVNHWRDKDSYISQFIPAHKEEA